MRMRLPLAVVLAGMWAVGCADSTDMTLSDDEIDATVLARIASYDGMPRVNAQPYRSELGAFDVNNFVTGDISAYRRIHPEQRDSDVRVAVGTTIVREVLDAQGKTEKLTVMAKGPPGFDPSLGDWWFGVTDPMGAPLVENGTPMIGRLVNCHDCHRERDRDDFLFGVPSSAQ